MRVQRVLSLSRPDGVRAAGGAQAQPVAAPTQLEPVCGTPGRNRAACYAIAAVDETPLPRLSRAATPDGLGPKNIQSAYSLPSDSGAGRTIAIVDAYDNPNAEADLAVYREQYGLSPCTTANGCLTKVDQRGGTNYPQPSDSWAGAISLGLDMVSASAPAAHILLVETDNDRLGDDRVPLSQRPVAAAGLPHGPAMTTNGISISLNQASPVPAYEQLRSQLSDLISVGRLRQGDRLPSVRQFASDLGPANNTVVRAYRELETAGLVKSRRGSGTQVAAPTATTDVKAKLAEHARSYAAAAKQLNSTDEEALAAIRHALATRDTQ
jgi:GntR family transcriptional regulator